MEYLWHNSTNEHKITYSRKGRFCFFLFFASPVATFFHYFAQNVRVTLNLRKKGGERRRASKSNSIIAKRPAKRKSRAEEQYQVSILPLGKWRMHSHHGTILSIFDCKNESFAVFFAIYSQPVFTTAPVYIDWLLSQINLLYSKVEEYFPVISSFFV